MTNADLDSRRQERAFTLLEVIFAGFVLTIASLGFAGAMPAATRLNDQARNSLLISQAINSKFAEIAATSFAQAASTYHRTGFAVPELTPDPADVDGLPGEVVFAPGPDNLDEIYRVTLRIRWRSGGRVRTVETQRLLGNVRGEDGTPPTLAQINRSLDLKAKLLEGLPQ